MQPPLMGRTSHFISFSPAVMHKPRRMASSNLGLILGVNLSAFEQRAVLQPAQDLGAAVFHHIQHLLKSRTTAVVGIRHFGLVMFGAELAEHPDLALVF